MMQNNSFILLNLILNPCLKNREFVESFIIKVIWYFAKNAIQRAIVSKNKDEFFSDGYILRTIGGIMNYQEFALDHGYITRWLVSEVRKQEVHAAPVTIDQEQNVWIGSVGAADHVNPIRKAFLDDIKKNGLEDPIFEDFQPGGSVKFLGSDLTLLLVIHFSILHHFGFLLLLELLFLHQMIDVLRFFAL